jgi:hypothetical protein
MHAPEKRRNVPVSVKSLVGSGLNQPLHPRPKVTCDFASDKDVHMSVLFEAGTFAYTIARSTRNTLKASMAQQATFLPFRRVRVEFSSTRVCRFPLLPRVNTSAKQ